MTNLESDVKEMIGKTITYKHGAEQMQCEVLAVKAGPMLLDMSSKIGKPKLKASYRAKLKPIQGGKPFWTDGIAT